MKLYKVDFKKVRYDMMSMIPSGETGYGTECGKWVFKVSHGELSGTSIILIVVVYF